MFDPQSLPRVTPVVRILLPDAEPLITFLQRLEGVIMPVLVLERYRDCMSICLTFYFQHAQNFARRYSIAFHRRYGREKRKWLRPSASELSRRITSGTAL